MAAQDAPPRARRAPAPRAPSKERRAERRYAVPYDIDGPRVRLGVLWFLVAAVALTVGPFPTALVYGGAAAIAGAQAARCWRRRGAHPNEAVAAAMAGGMGVGACLTAGGTGVAMLVGTVFACVVASHHSTSPSDLITTAGLTVQCALFPGGVAASMVLLARLDQGSAIALLLLVSAYETGDYLVGSGAPNPYEGPAAGVAAVFVITFIVSTTPISTLGFAEAWIFGGAVAVGAPLGQLFASALLPSATGPASALRRLDSLLLVAPLWCWGIGLVI